VKADGFLVIVHGAVEELARARGLLLQGNPSRLDLHDSWSMRSSGPLPVRQAIGFSAREIEAE